MGSGCNRSVRRDRELESGSAAIEEAFAGMAAAGAWSTYVEWVSMRSLTARTRPL